MTAGRAKRTLRIATLASSLSSLMRPTSLRRISVDKGGTLSRITRPSLMGVKPSPLAWMAFSMSLIVPGSKGRITIWVGSGAPTEASCLIGVGEP